MSNPQEYPNATQSAYNYINAFKLGEPFYPPSEGLIVDEKPDSMALWILGKELAISEPGVREHIVALLVDVGVSSDPLQAEGAEVLRNQQITEILVGSGLVKSDIAREATLDALRKLMTQTDLARYEAEFIKALEKKPTEEMFLLIAKARLPKAKTLVDSLARSQTWKDSPAAKIALAAMGDTEIENGFLDAAETARNESNSQAFIDALGTLSLTGTQRSLIYIANQLRTPLVFEVPGAFRKSVRLNVLEALLYNFPDQPVLYPNNIVEEEDYTAAEEFCTRKLGVTYTTPPPPFMTYEGFPIPR
ncbi:MAG: hypothetical protein R6W71_02015 [Bacteroidales bacterium]